MNIFFISSKSTTKLFKTHFLRKKRFHEKYSIVSNKIDYNIKPILLNIKTNKQMKMEFI